VNTISRRVLTPILDADALGSAAYVMLSCNRLDLPDLTALLRPDQSHARHVSSAPCVALAWMSAKVGTGRSSNRPDQGRTVELSSLAWASSIR